MLPRGFELIDSLGPTGGSTLWRARRVREQDRVLLKLGAPEAYGALARLRAEYDLYRSLALPTLPRALALDAGVRAPALVLEDRPGERLEDVLRGGRPLTWPQSLRVACQLAAALAELHEAQVVHHDLRPANLLVDVASTGVCIVDLSRARRAGLGDHEPGAADEPTARDLAYISPEQTGRMPVPVDHRSDLYSLGVILYRLFSGILPYQANDPLEWVHCHLAGAPAPLHERAPGLPRSVSDLVMVLLAKPPGARYQSARGVEHDLRRCLAAWEARGTVEPFALRAQDHADRLETPRQLHGRARELEVLRESYRRVAAGGASELVLVAGPSGIGKTTLVRELAAPVMREGGTFLTAKFDPGRHTVPYATLAEALRPLAQRCLAGSENEVHELERQLREALGGNAQVITAILPELELVIGPPPPVATVGPVEAQNRLHATFRRFLGVFPRPGYPLVLFLDDLQWAEPESLALLTELLTGSAAGLLVVGAYRDGEVPPEHPLERVRAAVRAAGKPVAELRLAALPPAALAALLAETLACTLEVATPLAQLIHAKTGGEPFFALQFLATLRRDGLIERDPARDTWRWDVDRIAARDYTDNVVELVVDKLGHLPEATRALLTLAACLGTQVDLTALARAAGCTPALAEERLRPALTEGLLSRTDTGHRFLHDRIRQAAYSLLPEAERAELHLRIGRRLLAHASPEERSAGPYEIAVHFLVGAAQVEDPDERLAIAQLLHACARRARASAAYHSAATLLDTATRLLGAEAWARWHDLAHAIHLERADAAWLTGDFDEADRLLRVVLAHARTRFDRLAVHELEVKLHAIRGEHERSLDCGLRALRLVGLDTEAHPGPAAVEQALAATAALLGARPIEALRELPPMRDPEARAALRVAVDLMVIANMLDERLFARLVCFAVQTSVRHGTDASSAFAYAAMAMVLFGRGQADEALRLARVARELGDRGGDTIAFKVALYLGGTIHPWVQPYAANLPYLEKSLEAAVASGDFISASYLQCIVIWARFIAGEPLGDVYREAEHHIALLRRMKVVVDVPNMFVSLQRCIANLRGETFADDAAFDAARDRESRAVMVASHYVSKMQVRYLLGDLETARAAGEKAAATLWSLARMSTLAEYHFYVALVHAALHPGAAPAEQAAHRSALAEHLETLRGWAERCPENFGSKHALLVAELARLDGRELEAEHAYEQAIRLARLGGLVQNEAIANEAAARFHLARGLDTIAAAYLREAHACYAGWGADAKVVQLERDHPRVFTPVSRMRAAVAADRSATPGVPAEELDRLAIVKASQAISQKIVLDDLLETLMRVVLEGAGARTASLLLVRGGELVRAAAARVEQQQAKVTLDANQAVSDLDLPWSILNYVRRSRERVLLGDAAQPHPFSDDDYLRRRQPRSVLCLPILRQTELVGILYLENDLVGDAFTPERVLVMEVLATQAAISLESARLYGELRRENAERRQAEAALAESRAFLQGVVDNAAASIYVKDLEGRFLLVNRALAEVLRRDRGALLGKTDLDLFPREQAEAVRAFDARVLAAGAPLEVEDTVPVAGELRTYLSSKAPLTDSAGRVIGVCGVSTDITARKRSEAALRKSEEQLRHAQKMETIGNLAGGVAHDFNNLLVVILGYADMLALELDPEDPRHFEAEEIRMAGQRAAELTRQLLAFARRQVLVPEIVCLNDVLSRLERMLRRLIGEDIELAVVTDPKLGRTRVDPGQIEQVVMNLAVNSRDAMPGGGRLTIETANVELDEAYAAEHASAAPGPYVMLAATDTGIGMDEATRARVFEPFFTTKEQGKGTGLGLAMVFGIVKQSGGHIWLYSEPGKGTCFKLYFPRTDAVAAAPPAPDAARRSTTGDETILVVEDDARVRALTRTMLERHGYHVLEARSGSDAVRLNDEFQATIHLLLTDVVMPRMSGRELAERMHRRRREMKVLFMSGYAGNAILQHAILDGGHAFLQKPFTAAALAQRVREVLDRR